jgi:hypothetical protein
LRQIQQIQQIQQIRLVMSNGDMHRLCEIIGFTSAIGNRHSEIGNRKSASNGAVF